MREATLGRWMVRIAVAIGAGAFALGVSTATAQANVIYKGASSVQALGVAQTLKASSDVPRVTEDWQWG